MAEDNNNDVLFFKGPSADLSFRARLLRQHNAAVVDGLLARCPMSSFLLHVVVAGETMYLPSPTLAIDSKHMVPRKKGTIYFNTTSQSICICYGSIVTESTLVNQFAQVLDEDLDKAEALGKLVYQQTIEAKIPTIVSVTLQIHSGDAVHTEKSGTKDPFDGSWKSALAFFEAEATLLRQPSEPDDIYAIRCGRVQASAGSEASPLPTFVFLQGFLSTLGPHVFSRLLTISKDPDMTLLLMLRQTHVFLIDQFNHFRFLADLGLQSIAELGNMYIASLPTLTSLNDYRQLTDGLRTVVQLNYRWLHLVFPWYLQEQVKKDLGENKDKSRLKCYKP